MAQFVGPQDVTNITLLGYVADHHFSVGDLESDSEWEVMIM